MKGEQPPFRQLGLDLIQKVPESVIRAENLLDPVLPIGRKLAPDIQRHLIAEVAFLILVSPVQGQQKRADLVGVQLQGEGMETLLHIEDAVVAVRAALLIQIPAFDLRVHFLPSDAQWANLFARLLQRRVEGAQFRLDRFLPDTQLLFKLSFLFSAFVMEGFDQLYAQVPCNRARQFIFKQIARVKAQFFGDPPDPAVTAVPQMLLIGSR